MTKVILLQNMVFSGRRLKAGESVEVDEDQAASLQLMNLVYIPAVKKASEAEMCVDISKKETTTRGRKKASK